MRKFTTTVSFIADGKGSPQTDEIIEMQGYADPGDGGGAQWKFNGVTGQTVSQSPAQVVKAKLNDASGNQWNLVRDGNYLELVKLGAKAGDDITSIFNAAISEIGNDGGTMVLPFALEDNPALISSELTIRANVTVIGISKSSSWIKTPDGVDLAIFKCTNTSGITFKSFSHDMNLRSVLTSGITINVENGSDMYFDDIHVKDMVAAPINLFGGSNDITIGIITMSGGGFPDSRGLSLSDCSNVSIGQVKALNIITAVVNVSNSTNVTIGSIIGQRDTTGGTVWTSGKAVFRCTNNSSNVTVGTVLADGWSRGIFILTGSTDISVSSVGIDNCEDFGIWVEGDNGVDNPGAGNFTVSSGFIKNTGDESVRLSDTEGNVISALTVDGDINELNVNATSDKNMISTNRVLGAVNTVGAATVDTPNIVGA